MKIATIGTGRIVEEFLNAVKEVDGTECAAVFSRKEETGRALADKYGIKSVYTSYQELLKSPDMDYIYIASPNSLHFNYAFEALKAGKHVICEKPFTSTVEEAKQLISLAKEKKLFLFEAITTLHLPNYISLKEKLSAIGQIKLVQCNYSQYSSRYDKFLAGEITNAFDTKFSGGALQDINVYNTHFMLGLFGAPREVKYIANIAENGIDTSGILMLKYDDFICEAVGAKDSESPSFVIIQGTKGYIKLNSPANQCLSFEAGVGGSIENYNEQSISNRMVYELMDFKKLYEEKAYDKCYKLLEHSLRVINTLVAARKYAGIVFEADNK